MFERNKIYRHVGALDTEIFILNRYETDGRFKLKVAIMDRQTGIVYSRETVEIKTEDAWKWQRVRYPGC